MKLLSAGMELLSDKSLMLIAFLLKHNYKPDSSSHLVHHRTEPYPNVNVCCQPYGYLRSVHFTYVKGENVPDGKRICPIGYNLIVTHH